MFDFNYEKPEAISFLFLPKVQMLGKEIYPDVATAIENDFQ
jgi:hypothetical protein